MARAKICHGEASQVELVKLGPFLVEANQIGKQVFLDVLGRRLFRLLSFQRRRDTLGRFPVYRLGKSQLRPCSNKKYRVD